MSTESVYRSLAGGDPEAVQRFAPRVAGLAAAARQRRLAAAAPTPTRAPAIAATPRPAATRPSAPAPRPSLAEIHGAGINETRRRAGLAPLTSAELERELGDADCEPTNTTTKKSARRAAANAMAARQGLSTDQATIDSIWAASAQKLNASLPSRRGPDEERRASPGAKQSQGEIDAMWASLVADGNKQAGLRTPSRPR
jgi:hypothetical protein